MQAFHVLAVTTAGASAVMGGVLFGFSSFVMPALRRLPASEAVATMQAMNATAPRGLGLPLVVSGVALTMGVGTAVGGWRIVRTMGLRLTKLEPVHGFAAETAAAVTIEVATRLGIPVSTTQTINTAIIGVGATRRLSAVRWGVTFEIVTAWILTFPVCGMIGWLATKILMFFEAV